MSAEGIKIFVDIVCFQGEHYWKTNPECRPVNSDGQPIQKIKWYAGVCPSQLWLREQIIIKSKKFAKQAGIKGIWLDFIRYPVHWEVSNPQKEQSCFCSVCLNRFQKETNLTIPANLKSIKEKANWILKEHKSDWIQWKCQNIAQFVKGVRAAVKSVNPECILGIFSVPWHDDEGAQEIVGQNYSLLAESVDIFSPMLYYSLNKRNPEWIQEFVTYTIQKTRRPVWPILYAGDSYHPVSVDELQKAMQLSNQSGGQGILVISWDELINKGMAEQIFSKK